jgi:flagellar protein FliO/FliZ
MLLYADKVDSIASFFTVLVIFIFILVITYFTTRYIANYQKGKFGGKNIKVIESARLTTNKFLQIVQIGDEYFAIALGKDEVTFISKLDKDNLNLTEVDADLPGFKEIFEKAKAKLVKKNDDLSNFKSDSSELNNESELESKKSENQE